MANYNSRYRDSVFRSYFNEPVRFLSLCNAILGTQFTNPDELNINTLEGIFFDKQKNDISCTIGNNFLVLVEHQTTVNENMLFRRLSYVTELLNNLVKNKNRLYYKGLIKFPKPKFFVFYNGDKNEPLQRKMRLSDAFDGDSTSIELVVTAYNINCGLPQPLLQNCRYLSEYSTLVGKDAVNFCIEEGIMKGYLKECAEEVIETLMLQWDNELAMQARFEEGREEGIEFVALNMIRLGMTVDKIQELTQLSSERIQELARVCWKTKNQF